jgi:amino acid transporter
MSYDPYGYEADAPRRPAIGSYDQEYETRGRDFEEARARVQGPAIALIVIGVLNLLGCLYWVFNAAVITITPADQLNKQNAEVFKVMGIDPAQAQSDPNQHIVQLAIAWGLMFGGIIATILTLVGGIRMMAMRNYALGVVGAVAAIIPCVSCSACCGLGEGIGIWALVVLLNEQVRSAFR